ncbi:hypothetical protein DFH08DRAFT_1034470 [Mycena albidolilacea]|uniref:Uncharacterized protein n=1 Tax=Mycena albidolilacea TaxID=1033008 RepID=A0AAD6ZFG9_9AGAR|nr:hypothetical protein DFH08DRAFT_1034470 [Mycena albidolilacea]
MSSSEDPESFALRDVYLNFTLVQVFGNGLYFVIFFLALYAMIVKRKTHKVLFIVVVLMYMFATIQTGVHWAIIRNAFITHGISSDDTVNALTGPTFTMVVLPATLLVANTFLADCVLIFRCYAVWNHDWRVIVLPTLSTIGGTVLGILTVVESGNFIKYGGDSNSFVDFARPYFSMCLVTTLLATVLIVFRILWLTRDPVGTAFSGYRAIVEMVVESALLYSITLIIYIVLLFGPDTSNNDGYAQAILIQMTGIAPTLIVARVSFGLARPSSSWQRSSKTAHSRFGSTANVTKQIHFSGNEDLESRSAVGSAIEMKEQA